MDSSIPHKIHAHKYTHTYTATAAVCSSSVVTKLHIICFIIRFFSFHIKLNPQWPSGYAAHTHTLLQSQSLTHSAHSFSELLENVIGCWMQWNTCRNLGFGALKHPPSSPDWGMLLKKKEWRISWQGEKRTRKYFVIWGFIQSVMGTPDSCSPLTCLCMSPCFNIVQINARLPFCPTFIFSVMI